MEELRDLIGRTLGQFTIEEFTEVYTVDVDGQNPTSIGFFRDETIAKAFAHNQPDAIYHKTEKVLVLTDGEVGFCIGRAIEILDDEAAALEARKTALEKLTSEERKLLKV